MNKIFFLTSLLFCIACKSQSNIIDMVDGCNQNYNGMNGSTYLKDISDIYQPFVGTWKWASGNKEMTLVLIKQTKFHYNAGVNNYYKDRLVGYYIYKENGIEIINTSNDDLMSEYGSKIGFSIYCNDYSGAVHTVFFKDVPKNKDYEVKLEMLSPTQMKFTGKMGQYSIIAGKIPKTVHGGYSFPLDMTFTKQ